MSLIEVYTPTDLRRQQAKGLAAIIRNAGSVELDMEFVPDFERDHRFDHGYGRLAEDIFVNFNRIARAVGNERLIRLAAKHTGLHGLYVMTRTMSYSPDAYVKHKQAGGSLDTANLGELASIAGRSSEILDPFTHCDIKTNTELEMGFGLLKEKPIDEESPPFVIDTSDNGSLVMRPSARTLMNSKINVARRKLLGEIPMDAQGRCPAVGMVMEYFWEDGVKECTVRPELFQTDLKVALAALKSKLQDGFDAADAS